MSANDYKQAVILSGGGAYGAYEVGVMKALFNGKSPATNYAPLDPDIFTGTSVGAINASILVSRTAIDITKAIAHLERMWVDEITDRSGRCGNGIYRFRVDPFRYLDPDCFLSNPLRSIAELSQDGVFLTRDFLKRGLNFFFSSATLEQKTLKLFSLSSFIEVTPFKVLLRDIIEMERIRQSHKALRIVTTNWRTGELRVFENADMADELGYDIILSSAAIPGFFPPYIMQGDPYVDGGVVMNTPLQCAIDAGANVLHIVYLDPDILNIPLQALEDTVDTLEKVYTIMTATITGEDVKTAQWINDGLEALERAGRGENLSDPDMVAFIRVAGQIEKRIKQGPPYRKLTIHQYRPRDLLGGAMGVLDFRINLIERLVDRGFNDAVAHNCKVNNCVIPSEMSVATFG